MVFAKLPWLLDVFFLLVGGEELSTCAALCSAVGVEAGDLLEDAPCALGRFFADFKCAGAEFCFGSRILALAPRRLLPPVPTKPPFCAALLTSERAQNTKLSDTSDCALLLPLTPPCKTKWLAKVRESIQE